MELHFEISVVDFVEKIQGFVRGARWAAAVSRVALATIPAGVSGALKGVVLARAVVRAVSTIPARVAASLGRALLSNSGAADLKLVPEVEPLGDLLSVALDGDSFVVDELRRVLAARVVKTALNVSGPASIDDLGGLSLSNLDLSGEDLVDVLPLFGGLLDHSLPVVLLAQ